MSDDVSMCYGLNGREIEIAIGEYSKKHIVTYKQDFPIYIILLTFFIEI